MRTLFVLALSLLTLSELLGASAVRVSGVTIPMLAMPWAFAIVVAVLAFVAFRAWGARA